MSPNLKAMGDKEVGIVNVVQYPLSEGLKEEKIEEGDAYKKQQQMPRGSVMTRLVLTMVWRNLIRNPNTYACVLGLAWSLISFRYLIFEIQKSILLLLLLLLLLKFYSHSSIYGCVHA